MLTPKDLRNQKSVVKRLREGGKKEGKGGEGEKNKLDSPNFFSFHLYGSSGTVLSGREGIELPLGKESWPSKGSKGSRWLR